MEMINGCALKTNKSSTIVEDPIIYMLPREIENNRKSNRVWEGLSMFEMENSGCGSSTFERAQVPTEYDKSNRKRVDQDGSELREVNTDTHSRCKLVVFNFDDYSMEDCSKEGSETRDSISDDDWKGDSDSETKNSTSDEDWKVESEMRDTSSDAETVGRRMRTRRVSKIDGVSVVHTDSTKQHKPKRGCLVKKWAVSALVADNEVPKMARRRDTGKSVVKTSEKGTSSYDDDWKVDSGTNASSKVENLWQHMTMRRMSKNDGIPAVDTGTTEKCKRKRRHLVKKWEVSSTDANNEAQKVAKRRDTGKGVARSGDAFCAERKHDAGNGIFIPSTSYGMQRHALEKRKAEKIWIEQQHTAKKKQKRYSTKSTYTLDTGKVWLEQLRGAKRRERPSVSNSVTGTMKRSKTPRHAENSKDRNGINIGRCAGLSKDGINRNFERFFNQMQDWDKIRMDGHGSNARPGKRRG